MTLLMIKDGEKWYYLAVKKLSTLLNKIPSKYTGILIVQIKVLHLEQKTHSSHIKTYVKIMTTAT